jgi:hypothetical protein
MTGGQSIDLGAEGRALEAAELEHMFSLKTGALIRASVMSASVLANCTRQRWTGSGARSDSRSRSAMTCWTSRARPRTSARRQVPTNA